MKEKRGRVEASARVCLDRVAVVLFRPRLAENIGAVARAACNMGINRLVAVAPQDLDRDRMAMMATGPAERLLDRMEVHDDLARALGPFQYIVGTTARLGGVRNDYFSPREMAARLVEISAANDVALLFGPGELGPDQRRIALLPRPGHHPHRGLLLPEPGPGRHGHGL